MTKIKLQYDGITETLECFKVEQTDWSTEDWSNKDGIATTLCGLSTHHIGVDSRVFDAATPGRSHDDYYGISQSMADPRCERSEEFPMMVISPNSDIEVIEINDS